MSQYRCPVLSVMLPGVRSISARFASIMADTLLENQGHKIPQSTELKIHQFQSSTKKSPTEMELRYIITSILTFYLASILTFFHVLSGILSDLCSDMFWHSFWHSLCHVFGSRLGPLHLELAIWCSGRGVAHSIRSWEENRSDSARGTPVKEWGSCTFVKI